MEKRVEILDLAPSKDGTPPQVDWQPLKGPLTKLTEPAALGLMLDGARRSERRFGAHIANQSLHKLNPTHPQFR